MPVEYEIDYNIDSSGVFAPGKAMIKLMRSRYDKMTAIGNVSGNPAGTAVQAAKFLAGTTTGAAHTHTINHDHPSTTSATPTAGGGAGVNSGLGQPAIDLHTHDVDIVAFTGSSASSATGHNRSFEYDHNHANTQASTNAALTEVAAGTNLSTTVFRYAAWGF